MGRMAQNMAEENQKLKMMQQGKVMDIQSKMQMQDKNHAVTMARATLKQQGKLEDTIARGVVQKDVESSWGDLRISGSKQERWNVETEPRDHLVQPTLRYQEGTFLVKKSTAFVGVLMALMFILFVTTCVEADSHGALMGQCTIIVYGTRDKINRASCPLGSSASVVQDPVNGPMLVCGCRSSQEKASR